MAPVVGQLAALATQAKHVELMGGDGEPVSAGDFFLKLFDEWMVELDNFSAFCADHMVVVAVHICMLIAFLPVTKIKVCSQAALSQQC